MTENNFVAEVACEYWGTFLALVENFYLVSDDVIRNDVYDLHFRLSTFKDATLLGIVRNLRNFAKNSGKCEENL